MALENDLKFLLNFLIIVHKVTLIGALAFNQELLHLPVITKVQRHHLTRLMLRRQLNALANFTISEVALNESLLSNPAYFLVKKNVFLNLRGVNTCQICL